MELVSVIVPVYNVEKYLDKCIQSIINQTYQKLEIILVDDGSPDRCGIMCEQYAELDGRIRVIHKKNGGLSDARNVGVERASGKYLLFVDSDDFIDCELVEKTVESAEAYQSDIVLFDYKRLEPDGSIEFCCINNLPENKGFQLREYPKVLFKSISAWNKLFLKQFFVNSNIQFPVGYCYEDLGSSPRYLLAADKISYVKETFYNYVIREGSIMSATKEEKNYHDRCRMIEIVKAYYQLENAYDEYRKELEYLALFHGYYIPAKEILFRKGDRTYINEFRNFVVRMYPDYSHNIYLKGMSSKEKFQFYMIEHKQYWMVNLLSFLRKTLKKEKNRRDGK